MPRCFQCGHPVADVWTEGEGPAWCLRCRFWHDSIVRCMEQTLRRYFETAIGRIPKKRKPVAS